MSSKASLAIESGRVVIAGCTDYLPDAARVSVAPGPYRVRFSCRGLATVAENCPDGDDSYLVQIWTADASDPGEVKLLKQARDRL